MASNRIPRLPIRENESHKGDYGRLLVIGGSRGMTGAIALCGMAALRSGAGLVYLALPQSCWNVVAVLEPSYLTIPLPDDDHGRLTESSLLELRSRRSQTDVLAIGPGLGMSSGVVNVVRECYVESTQPIVVDADAINALAAMSTLVGAHRGARILTPHPGEFRRLAGREPSREAVAALAAENEVVVVLKGHRTFVTDGEQAWVNGTGNPGMATGGSGDVLTGIIAALLGQGLTPFDAARLGVHVHGLSGDLAAARLGQISLTALDLVQSLPEAWVEHQQAETDQP